MNIFQIKTKPHGIERFNEFTQENFISIGWPGIGDLKDITKDEIRERLTKKTGYSGHKLGNALGQVNAFINTMKIGDVVLITEKNWAYIGTIGEYMYDQQYDNENDGMCHRRSVKWTNRVPFRELPSGLQRLVNNRNTICRYPDLVEESGIDKITGKTPIMRKENNNELDGLFSEALLILGEELKSDEPDRRLKAAIEILRLKNR